jgi:hypothetical protein
VVGRHKLLGCQKLVSVRRRQPPRSGALLHPALHLTAPARVLQMTDFFDEILSLEEESAEPDRPSLALPPLTRIIAVTTKKATHPVLPMAKKPDEPKGASLALKGASKSS